MPGGPFLRRVAAGVVVVALGLSGVSHGHAASGGGGHAVASVRYTLGDTAFRVPGFHELDPETGEPGDVADLELTAVVHYPRDLRGGPYPLVVVSHGMWETCADRAAGATWTDAMYRLYGPDPVQDPAEIARLEAAMAQAGTALNRWPCAPGTPPMPSYRGYDYLGRALARTGIVTVSISANGVNAGELGQAADMARAALINQHLRMWRDLSATGGGALKGRFTALDTGRPVSVDFTGRVDMTRVGTVGHSRGGRGVMWHASDNHRAEWPAGVAVQAAVPLAAAEYYAPDPDAPENLDYRVTRVPFAAVTGSCDYSVGGGRDYLDNARGRNTVPLYLWEVRGANHNYLNSQWSPRSRQVLAHDDVQQTYDLDPDRDRPRPGHCDGEDGVVDAQLTETEQRLVTTTYLTAFFRRHLLGDTRVDPVLTGRQHPVAHITAVNVETVPPR